MKYFLNENERKATGSTCYHEFYKGKWNTKKMLFWNDDSMYISDDMMYDLKLDELISSVVKGYDSYGETEINEIQWNKIKTKAEKMGGVVFEAITEITPWVEDNYMTNRVFTILGI